VIGALFTALSFFIFFAAVLFLLAAACNAGCKLGLNILQSGIAQFHITKVRRKKSAFT